MLTININISRMSF